jgi:hypothetical protein
VQHDRFAKNIYQVYELIKSDKRKQEYRQLKGEKMFWLGMTLGIAITYIFMSWLDDTTFI